MGNLDISEFLEQVVYPRLWSVIPNVFPEFGFVHKQNHWQATDRNYTKTLPSEPRPARVCVYQNSCFGYEIHGHGFITWLEHLNHFDKPMGERFVQVARQLCELVGETLPERAPSPKVLRQIKERDRKQLLLEAFWSYAQERLTSGDGRKALEYAQSRGIDKAKTQQYFGYFPSVKEIQTHLQHEGFSEEEIGYGYREVLAGKSLGSGLCYDGRWEGRLIGVWRDRVGRIVNFWARDISGKAQAHEKYLMLKGGSKDSPYGLDQIRGSEAVLVEGFFDALSL